MIVFALDIIYAYKQDIIIYFFSGDNFAVNAYACIAYRSLFHFTSRNPTTVNSVDQSCSLPYVIVYIGIAIMDKLNGYVSVFLICVGFFCKRILLFAVIGQSILLLNTFVYNLKFVGRKSTGCQIDIYNAVAAAFGHGEYGKSVVACSGHHRSSYNVNAVVYAVKCVITAIGIKIGYF